MDKPTVFFSHSSRDKKPLRRLRELFLKKTGETIDLFLSCDGQSIPFGTNWVAEIQDALERARLMFVFVTPQSVNSNWIHFESGHAYAKGIDTVPVGFLEFDLDALRPPLGLLQGFNINSAEGLSNLIVKVNEAFRVRHEARFTRDEYVQIVSLSEHMPAQVLGEHWRFVATVTLELNKKASSAFDVEKERNSLQSTLDKMGIKNRLERYRVILEGVTIDMFGSDMHRKQGTYGLSGQFHLDPILIKTTMPQVEAIARECFQASADISLSLRFLPKIADCFHAPHMVSARLFESQLQFTNDGYVFRDLRVDFGFIHAGALEHPVLKVKATTSPFPLDQLGDLIDLLFERGVLSVK